MGGDAPHCPFGHGAPSRTMPATATPNSSAGLSRSLCGRNRLYSRSYVAYSLRPRIHLALDNDPPMSRPVKPPRPGVADLINLLRQGALPSGISTDRMQHLRSTMGGIAIMVIWSW
jgi:hypothetical protein